MPDTYVIEVSGRTAGIVARDSQTNSFNFFSAAPRFNAIEGQRFYFAPCRSLIGDSGGLRTHAETKKTWCSMLIFSSR
jgi:hypothetical protein